MAEAQVVLVDKESGLMVEHLGKQYGKRPVVRDVSISVQRGEAVGLLGPNGAGKTTCFYMITGLIRADYGSIRLDGNDITSLPMYRRARLGIGYLPQETSNLSGHDGRAEYSLHAGSDRAGSRKTPADAR